MAEAPVENRGRVIQGMPPVSVACDHRPLAEGKFADWGLANRGGHWRRLFSRQVGGHSTADERDRRQNSQEKL